MSLAPRTNGNSSARKPGETIPGFVQSALAAYGTADATIDKELIMQVLEENISSKTQKKSWLSKEEAEHMVADNK
jgi:hypothetical protein